MLKRFNFIFVLALILSPLYAQQQHSGKDYILILHSVNFSDAWTTETNEAILRAFNNDSIDTVGEELQIPAITEMEEVDDKLNILRRKYSHPPKAIVCIGDPAWLLCRPLFKNEWKDSPTLVCYSQKDLSVRTEDLIKKDFSPSTMAPAQKIMEDYNVTALHFPFFVKETVDLMRHLQPQIKKILFICDNRFISITAKKHVQTAFKEQMPELELKIISTPEYSTENLLDTLGNIGYDTGIIYYSWFISRENGENQYLLDNVQKMTNSFSAPPVYLINDLGLEAGNFAGGYYISIHDFAQSAVSIIRDMLNGKNRSVLPEQASGTPYTYLNYKHLQSHGIDPVLYPEKAIYFDQPPTFFEKNKFKIIGISVITILLLIIASLRIRLIIQKKKQRDKETKITMETEELNQKYRLILKASRTTVWIWDISNKKIECDQESFAAEQQSNARYSIPEKDLYEAIHPDDRMRIQKAYLELKNGSINILHHEFRIWRPEENRYDWLDCYGIAGKKDKNEHVQMLVGSSITITERKMMESELLEKKKVEEANRLKSAFLANMSHEIRTPLNAIVGFSNLILQGEVESEEEKQEFSRIILTNNELLLQLINDILDLSKIEAGKLELTFSEIQVSEILIQLAQTFKERTKPGVQLHCLLPKKNYIIYSERNRLMQVITNFLTNACKFTFNGSITLGYEEAEKGLRFYVADTGKGISEENLSHVFERFAKFDAFIQGTGLGLSICETIIQNLGGEIGAESKIGVGSRFWFIVPFTSESTQSRKQKYLPDDR